MENTTEKPFVFLSEKILDYCLELMYKNHTFEQVENALQPIKHFFSRDTYRVLIDDLRNRENDKTRKYEGRKYPDFELNDTFKSPSLPKPAYLSDEKIHPSVRNLFEALYQKLPEYSAYLYPPCNEEDLLLVEKTFEVELPKAFKDFYRITDGLMERVCVNETFLSLKTILQDRKSVV